MVSGEREDAIRNSQQVIPQTEICFRKHAHHDDSVRASQLKTSPLPCPKNTRLAIGGVDDSVP